MLKRIKDRNKAISLRRKSRIRFKLKRNNKKPRLSIFVSNMHVYAQLIDDMKGVTIAAASTLEGDFKSASAKTSNKEAAKLVGKLIAERSLKAGVSEVLFDRGGHLFHGKVKCLADTARENGLKF